MSKTIVHADDSASVRRWVADQLSDMDFQVVSVADGEAALNLLRDSPCDLLLTDLEMPNLDGLGLVAAVRELPSPSVSPGPGSVLPASQRVRAPSSARRDRMDGQADRFGASPPLGSSALAGLDSKSYSFI